MNRLALVTDPETSARLGRIRQKGTGAELLVRQMVVALGRRYTLENRDLSGAPDLANRTQAWAIFVHGCFWHRHTNCYRSTTPHRNRAFWLDKFDQNVLRDRRVKRRLQAMGYRVLVIWECETKYPARLTSRIAGWFERGMS